MKTLPDSTHLAEALSSAAIALGRTREADEVVRVAVAETQRATGVEAVALHLLDRDRDELVLREFAGRSARSRERLERLPLSQAPLAARAIRDRVTVAQARPDPPDTCAAQDCHHAAWVPVEGREEVLGVLQLASSGGPELERDALAVVHAIGGLVGVALENAALREALTAQRDRLRALAEGAIQAHEEEARRIAHELHDEAGQLLASVHIALDGLGQQIPEHGQTIRRLHDLLDRVEGQLRRLSRELRPTILDDLGLAPALEWLTQGMSQRAGVRMVVRATVARLEPRVETALYRIIQEALTNAVRHARATRIEVEVCERGRRVEAVVQDDGVGFNVVESLSRRGDRGLGLIGMRERAETLGGQVRVVSSAGAGTQVCVTIPLEGRP
jgi:signal transduction histidine kinase